MQQVINSPLFDIDFERIWVPVRRSLLPMTAIMGVCIAAAVLAFLLIRPSYRAEAKMRIESSAQKIVGTEDANTPVLNADIDRQMETTLLMARSMPVAEAVMRSLRLNRDQSFTTQMNAKPAQDVADRRKMVLALLDKGLSAAIVPNTRVATIGFSSPDPVLSATIANSFAENLVRFDLQQRAGQSDYAREFLEGELAKIRVRLSNSERSANDYARNAAIIVVPTKDTTQTGATLTSDVLNQVNQQLAEAGQRRIRAQADWNAIAEREPLSIPSVVGNAAIQSLISQTNEAQARLMSASARHGPEHPEVRQLTAQSTALQRSLSSLAAGIKSGLRTPLDSAIRDEAELKAKLANLRSVRLSEQDRNVDLAILQREAETNRNQYDALLARLNQLNAEAGVQVSNLSIFDRAAVPQKPYFPSLPLFLVAGIILGTILALVFLLVRELLFARVRSPSDVVARLQLPVLASIPFVKDGVDDRLLGPYSEAIAALQVSTDHGLPRTLLLTSAGIGDGKSTSIDALAQSLSASGKSVLIIDGDLRRPVQHLRFGLTGETGLTNVLAGQATFAETVQTTSYAGISLLPAGSPPPQPAALLSSPNLAQLIDEAKSKFDIVLIDSAPMIGFGDPLLLAAQAEIVVFVIHADTSRPARIRTAVDKLANQGSRPLGAILTFYRPTTVEKYDYALYNYAKR
ncbi:GumC family protein [Sphingomonas sp. 35-24ZXX]|uniref:GumC family protein n=1 Tax=Sphingomonas sp. 35-24ZXX TaxID=1545915 RepID=UPI00053BFCF2|nr:polysaccharide biosynthesis tyrosine autokinase [Sphingomonas sp. 35-24ZXX]